MKPRKWAVVGSAAVLGVGGGIAAAATLSPLRDPVSVLEMDRSPVQLGSEVPNPLDDPTAPVEVTQPDDPTALVDLTTSPEPSTVVEPQPQRASSEPAPSTSQSSQVRRSDPAPKAVSPAPAVGKAYSGSADSPDSGWSVDSVDSADSAD